MFKSGKETKALLLLGCYKIGFALLCVGLLFASADQGWFNESQFERVFQKWPLEGEANLASYLTAWGIVPARFILCGRTWCVGSLR